MELITTKLKSFSLSDFENDLTREMDRHLISQQSTWQTYIYCHDRRKNGMALRYPGATRGHIEVDDDMVIKEILLYDTATDNCVKCYKESVKDVVNKFIGCKIVFE